MQIKLNNVFVEDQAEALAFYTDVLGFVKKTDFPVGSFRWLTVVSPEGPPGIELLLEPNDNPATKQFQQAMMEQGIPMRAFSVDDVEAEHKRLKQLGVVFRTPPMDVGSAVIAVFEDTCGNLIQIYQSLGAA